MRSRSLEQTVLKNIREHEFVVRGCKWTLLFVIVLSVVLLTPIPSFFAGFPAAEIPVGPEDNLEAKVTAAPAGTTFLVKSGIHRLQAVVPKNGDSFVGEPGAVLSGAVQLASFQQKGSYWVARIPARLSEARDEQTAAHAKCLQARAACGFPEDLFVDNKPLERVSEESALAAGKWYLDYATNSACLGEPPAGRTVELSVTRHAFSGSAADVTIRGLIIEKCANPAQTGAIHALGDPGPCSRHWSIESNELRLNHGGGVKLCDTRLIGNNIHDNGQIGVIGVGNDELIQGNEIAGNNYAGYDYRWEAGGTKFAEVHNLIVRQNNVHDNKGPGLWTDSDNSAVLYEDNHTRNNLVAGIAHEISFDAVIRNNTIENDGYDPQHSSPWYGAGIDITGSSNVEIYGNIIKDCMNGIIAKQPERGSSHDGRPYVVKNLYVHDNKITQTRGIAIGLLKGGSFDNSVFMSWNNRFENNTFNLTQPDGKYFIWENTPRSFREWKSLANGTRATE